MSGITLTAVNFYPMAAFPSNELSVMLLRPRIGRQWIGEQKSSRRGEWQTAVHSGHAKRAGPLPALPQIVDKPF